jgi:hypothetical protein
MNYLSPKRSINSYIYSNNSLTSENFEFGRDKDESENLLRNDSYKLINFSSNEFYSQFIYESNKPTHDEDILNDSLPKNILFEAENDIDNEDNEIFNENNNDNNLPLPINIVQEKNEEIETLLRRKRNNSKFKSDSLIRKVKHILLDNILNFINGKISEFSEHKSIFGKLKNIGQKARSEGNAEYNKKFLNKTLFDIFSSKITGRITNYLSDYNEKIIDNLLKEKDLNKRQYFSDLFNLTFVQSLNHFNETNYYKELNGMKRMVDEVKKESEGDEEYENNLKYYFLHFEDIINKKKGKKIKIIRKIFDL